MKLPKKMQQQMIEKCKESVHLHADKFPPDSFLGEAHRNGTLSATLDKMLPPFAAEIGIMEGAQLASLAKKYASADPTTRVAIENQIEEIILRVARRIPGDTTDWNQAIDLARALARAMI